MLTYESLGAPTFALSSLEASQPKQEPSPIDLMDSYAAYNSLPFAFYEPPTPLVDVSQNSKFDLSRSFAHNAFHQPPAQYADVPPTLLSAGSGPSVPSAPSSTLGSPYLGHRPSLPAQDLHPTTIPTFLPNIATDDVFAPDFTTAAFTPDALFDSAGKLGYSIDPVLISPHPDSYFNAPGYGAFPPQAPINYLSPAPSPAPSSISQHSFHQPITVDHFGAPTPDARRHSFSSHHSMESPIAACSSDEESKDKGRCPYADCGRVFKDLKAHMLTHEKERPEKCPIVTCEYNKKGFARKYDKNRHTLTHYKGTMVCGFCPGSGSSAEKSFNRADVFKRHLTSVHSVEQTAPNSRKRSPGKVNVKLSSYCHDATGKCSTCSATFSNAQDFYEHLDDCVLRVVQQEEPSEAINAQLLADMVNDADVKDTLERNHILPEDKVPFTDDVDEDDEDDEEEADDEDDELTEQACHERKGSELGRLTTATGGRPIIGGNISKKPMKKGLTWSKGGGAIIGKSRKRRKHYPASWGMATDKMNMKKRVLCVYDGQRRLLKDDMMMHNEFEVRVRLPEGSQYVTDLDIETLNRAEAFHHASLEEKGPFIPEQDFLQEFLH